MTQPITCGADEWQLFMTDEEVAEWESLEAHRVEIQRKIAKIKKRCNKRRARFNQGSIKDTKTQKTPATRAGEV